MLAQKHGWPGPCLVLVRGQQLLAGLFRPHLIHGVEHTARFVLLPFSSELFTIFFLFIFRLHVVIFLCGLILLMTWLFSESITAGIIPF